MVKIPPEYRDQLVRYDEPLDYLSEEDKIALKEKEEREKGLNTNVVISENNIIIPVKMTHKGKEVDVALVLDTGASITMIHRDAAFRLGVTDTQKSTATVAGGEKITFDLARLDSVKVGPFEKKDILVGILDYRGGRTPHNGLLGMNFLQHYEYMIDYENKMVRWHPGNMAPR